jgi:hypothetical protein
MAATNGSCSSNGDGKAAAVPEIKYTKLFINGEFVDAVSGMQPHVGEHIYFFAARLISSIVVYYI